MSPKTRRGGGDSNILGTNQPNKPAKERIKKRKAHSSTGVAFQVSREIIDLSSLLTSLLEALRLRSQRLRLRNTKLIKAVVSLSNILGVDRSNELAEEPTTEPNRGVETTSPSEDYNERTPERTELLTRLKSFLGGVEVPSTFWAGCQIGDTKRLERLIQCPSPEDVFNSADLSFNIPLMCKSRDFQGYV